MLKEKKGFYLFRYRFYYKTFTRQGKKIGEGVYTTNTRRKFTRNEIAEEILISSNNKDIDKILIISFQKVSRFKIYGMI
tara:strand:- start:696 stop:932 length:237 start_codon:yes stop_codon:yes gene_type:complete